ncbi:beta-1,6-N-acetylglucosaminyltransferase [Cesiribacter sp. SM1]|uniref:beta-1,6-N-acetylglucosaminyltransferase n=1 Tax=Cesiribacter sp. SM1 TaxID=2861196 RepID=UPI001CD7A553|nr:beta-1,6-N-acetylglucosaminyltransferase [Cesiribacter sp. SM1]
MKIAVLILAHKNIEQLELLIERLYGSFEIFIHLDKKWHIRPGHFSKYPGVQVIQKYSISWASAKISSATLDLLRLAHKQQCHYYLVISGQDFPIRSNGEIRHFLEENRHLNFMEYAPLPIAGWGPSGGFHRLQLYWPEEKEGVWGKLVNKFGRSIRRLQLKHNYMRKLQPLAYYGGCNWVNINHATLTYILNYLQENPAYLKQYSETYISDEIWLHTLVMNSPFRDATINDWLRYIDWGAGARNPKTLGMEDLDKILASRGLFARKFDVSYDAEVLRRLNAFHGKPDAGFSAKQGNK